MIKLEVNTELRNIKAGSIIELETDEEGNILDSFWARRLQDSPIDNCVSVVTDKMSAKKIKKENE